MDTRTVVYTRASEAATVLQLIEAAQRSGRRPAEIVQLVQAYCQGVPEVDTISRD